MTQPNRPSSSVRQDPQAEIRRIAETAREALDSGIDISNEAVQKHIKAIREIYERNPRFKDNLEGILSSFKGRSKKVDKFIDSILVQRPKEKGGRPPKPRPDRQGTPRPAEQQKLNPEQQKSSETYKQKTRKLYRDNIRTLIIKDLKKKGATDADIKKLTENGKIKERVDSVILIASNPKKLKQWAKSHDMSESEFKSFYEDIDAFLDQKKLIEAFGETFSNGKLTPQSKAGLERALNDKTQMAEIAKKLKIKPEQLASQLQALLNNVDVTDPKSVATVASKIPSAAGASPEEMAQLKPADEAKNLLTRQNEYVDGIIQSNLDRNGQLNTVKATQQLQSTFETLVNQEVAIQTKSKAQAAATKKAASALSSSGDAAKKLSGSSTNLFNTLSQITSPRKSPLTGFANVFNLGPLVATLTPENESNILEQGKLQIENYVNALKGKNIPQLKQQSIEVNQKKIEANLDTIPPHRLNSSYAKNYAKLLNGGKIDMTFDEYMKQEVLPKMHPLMKIFWMIQEIMGLFSGLAGRNDKQQKKDAEAMRRLKDMAGVKTPEQLAKEKAEAQKNKEFKEFFLSQKLWENVKIKVRDDVTFDLNEKGKDKSEKAKNARLDYFQKNKGSVDKFKKLLDPKNGLDRKLLSKGLSLKTLEGIYAKKEQFVVNGENLEIKDTNKKTIKTIKLSEVTDEKLQEALDNSNAASKGEKILEKAGKSKDDIKGIDQKLKELLGRENFSGSKKEAKNLIEKAKAIIKNKNVIDSSVKISDLISEAAKVLFVATGDDFNDTIKSVFKLNAEPKLRVEDFKVLINKFGKIKVKNGKAGIESGIFSNFKEFKSANDLIKALNGDKEVTYAETDKRKAAKKSKAKPDGKAEQTKPTTELTPELKTKLNKALEPFSGKLDGITAQNIPKNLTDGKGDLSKSFQSLLALDTKFWGSTKLTAANLKTISDKIGETSITFQDLNIIDNRSWYEKGSFNPFGKNKPQMFKAKNLTIGKGDADMTFKNIAEFIQTLNTANKK